MLRNNLILGRKKYRQNIQMRRGRFAHGITRRLWNAIEDDSGHSRTLKRVAMKLSVVTTRAYSNMTHGLGCSMGAALGGFMAECMGWRWMFDIQVSLLLAYLMASLMTIAGDLGFQGLFIGAKY
ncbi:hypothetical protein J3458_001657 [Metarhizium acridum]|uniref:uncharacterized protein n=1 Tax=Metarhizium acridum TaxID=92637 RepID=UPI001C6D1E0A|nr:hypothetical protein J3458_001657 [Metarhizium acridum]